MDLHNALLRKQERECARLDDFWFRHRARSIRLVAEWGRSRAGGAVPIDPREMAAEVVLNQDEAILDALAARLGDRVCRAELDRQYDRARAQAFSQLVAELGDPTPYSLA